jgi:hypothetical protein
MDWYIYSTPVSYSTMKLIRWRCGNALDLYTEGPWFGSLPGHWLSGTVPRLGAYHLLSKAFRIYHSSIIMPTASVV